MLNELNKIRLSKSSHSEEVIRKALYWLTESCSWELNESETEWLVTISTNGLGDPSTTELNRLINDFKLRESLDLRTKGLRMKLIQTSLAKIVSGD